jgi:hypothetical protein
LEITFLCCCYGVGDVVWWLARLRLASGLGAGWVRSLACGSHRASVLGALACGSHRASVLGALACGSHRASVVGALARLRLASGLGDPR